MILAGQHKKRYDWKLTVYSCQPDEASLFLRHARQYGIQLSLHEQPVTAENAVLAAGSRCISVSHTVPVTATILDKLHDVGVRYISTRSIGYDHIDIEYAEKIGIGVGNVSYSPNSVADYTLMLILMASRRVTPILRSDAQNYSLRNQPGHELNRLTVGVAGTGHIGQAVIERLRGFGCKILAYDAYPNPDLKPKLSYVEQFTLLSQSDILTLHMPATDATYHWINRQSLATMKCGAMLINTARGSLVDSLALIEALERGHLSGAALDVAEEEAALHYPEGPDKATLQLTLARLKLFSNVIMTPHTAFYTDRAVEEIVENSIKNCLLQYNKRSRGQVSCPWVM